MYLQIGQDYILHSNDLIGIFDLDNTSSSRWTRDFLKKAEQRGAVIPLGDDIPKSYLLTDWPADTTLYLSPYTGRTLNKRALEPETGFKKINKDKNT